MRPDRDVVLGDRYALQRRIAVGGMGEVWEATDTVLDRAVAVKLLKDQYRTAPTFLARFRAEARHAGGLTHAGIASVYDYGETDDAAYLVMELVAGRPLSEVIAFEPELPDLVRLSVLAQTADALQAAHDAGVVHRDVKPGNLIVRPDGRVKVTDFGIARALASAALTDTGQIVGTAAYISPEQATGAEVTPASDIYSWGVVAYELFAGRLPFERDSAVALAHAHVFDLPPPLPDRVPPGIASLIASALDKDPWQRPVSAAAAAWRVRAEMAAITDAAASACPPSATSAPSPVSRAAPAGPSFSHPADPEPRTAPTGPTHLPSAAGSTTLLSVPTATQLSSTVSDSPPESRDVLRVGSRLSARRRRRLAPAVLAFVAVLLIGAALVWALASRSDTDQQATASTTPSASVDAGVASSTAAPATTISTVPVTTAVTSAASSVAAPAEPAPVSVEPATTASTEPSATVADMPASTPDTTAAPVPSTSPALPPGRDRVDEDEAIAFVVDYYRRIAAGEYETTWASLSPEFRDTRSLTFERYVGYWQNTSIEISDVQFREGGGPDTARVRFAARYTTGARVVDETDEVTLRREPDGRLVIIDQRIV